MKLEMPNQNQSEDKFQHTMIRTRNENEEDGDMGERILVQRAVGRRKTDAEAGWYKSACLFMAGVLITLIGMWFTYIRNGVSRDELNSQIANHPTIVGLTRDVKNTSDRVGNVEATLDDVNVNIIRIGDAVGVATQHTKKPKVRTTPDGNNQE